MIIGAVTRADVPRLCERLRLLLDGGDVAVVACDVAALVADIVAVEALLHLQLTAQRLGSRVRLRHASNQLETLLDFCGLGGVLVSESLWLEASRQAEEREQRLGVEEEGEFDDLTR